MSADKTSLKIKLSQRPASGGEGDGAASTTAEGSSSDLRKKLEARRMQSSKGGGKTQSYAKLEGPHVRHLVRTVSVTLGRQRDAAQQRPPTEEAPGRSFSNSFVSLGSDKAISNTHLQIFWDFRKKEWVLICLGRNGAVVDGQRLKKGDMPVVMKNKARVQVPSGYHFVFLSPTAKPPAPKKQKGGGGKAALPTATSPVTGGEVEKPSQTFAELIAEAILSSSDYKLAVGEIYQHIKDSHQYYRSIPDGTWQSSIRHSLTSNKSFLKTTREHSATLAAPPSLAAANAQKGVCWTLRPEVLAELLGGGGMSVLNSKAQRDKLLEPPAKAARAHPPPTPPHPREDSSREQEVLLESSRAQSVEEEEADAGGEAEQDDGDLDAEDSDEEGGGMVIDE